ncbi:unnamed protein product [Vitrella brassicaformis CCMP3155]|uniref:Uncharacterized protein n=1 Tax=Vitrella brassicaformis (strain CCMP3155) TaxID=1169540 RepID=A0A0G4EAT7_VITBC|nr:unnamed protein product [Vitrella brassicaformis CCMP3155]|eukprot:CEL92393.1 unnamed protein product [Vitrella brassicaformis CCMP3155]
MGGEGEGRLLLHMVAESVPDTHRVRLRVEGCVTFVTEGEENKRGVCVLYDQTYTCAPSRSASLRPLPRVGNRL